MALPRVGEGLGGGCKGSISTTKKMAHLPGLASLIPEEWRYNRKSRDSLRSSWVFFVFLLLKTSFLSQEYKKSPTTSGGAAFTVVIRAGFEPTTRSLEGCCSIQLSYRTMPVGMQKREERREIREWPHPAFGSAKLQIIPISPLSSLFSLLYSLPFFSFFFFAFPCFSPIGSQPSICIWNSRAFSLNRSLCSGVSYFF